MTILSSWLLGRPPLQCSATGYGLFVPWMVFSLPGRCWLPARVFFLPWEFLVFFVPVRRGVFGARLVFFRPWMCFVGPLLFIVPWKVCIVPSVPGLYEKVKGCLFFPRKCVLFPKSSLRPAIEEIGNEKKGKGTRRRNGLSFARLIYPVWTMQSSEVKTLHLDLLSFQFFVYMV